MGDANACREQTVLGEQRWPEVPANAALLVPLGSTEQHGPHLPLDTDARIATAIACGAAKKDSSVLVAPTMPYGASGEHAGFAGTLSIGTDILRLVIIELVRSASQSFDRIVLVNGHGGNHEGVTVAVAQLADEGHRVRAWSPRIPNGDAHAGRTETSLMLAIAPECVRVEHMEAGSTRPLPELMSELRTGGVAAVSPNGVLGDPTGAFAAEGSALLAGLIDDLARTLAKRQP